MRTVTVRQAVTLSVDLDPDEIGSYTSSMRRYGRSAKDEKIFQDRLEVAANNLGEHELMAPTHIIMGSRLDSGVSLRNFAAWALEIKWQIPKALADLAAPSPSPEISVGRSEKLDIRERDSLLSMIRILASHAKLGLESPTSTAEVLLAEAKVAGLSSPSRNTLIKYLKEAAES